MVNDGPGGNAVDSKYVSFREHADIKDRVTRLEASLSHVPAEIMRLSRSSEKIEAALHELTRELNEGRKGPPPDAMSSAILALHRAVEAFTKPPPPAPAFPFSMTTVAAVAGGMMLLGALMGQAVGINNLIGVHN